MMATLGIAEAHAAIGIPLVYEAFSFPLSLTYTAIATLGIAEAHAAIGIP
jgi:hypothetical protein